MLLVNLYGPPSSGKSTTRADVFRRLKQKGVNCEEVYEYAKSATWQGRHKTLACQPYIFGKQLHAIEVLGDQVDVVITDSPLMLCHHYAAKADRYPVSFLDSIVDISSQFTTLDFYIRRVAPYSTAGRRQTEAESDQVGVELLHMMSGYGINAIQVDGDKSAGKVIAKHVRRWLKENNDREPHTLVQLPI
jgi:hypothetical protein